MTRSTICCNTFEVPVIFITAYPERFLTGERPEPAFLVSKPYQPATVSALVSQALFFERNAVQHKKRAELTDDDAAGPPRTPFAPAAQKNEAQRAKRPLRLLLPATRGRGIAAGHHDKTWRTKSFHKNVRKASGRSSASRGSGPHEGQKFGRDGNYRKRLKLYDVGTVLGEAAEDRPRKAVPMAVKTQRA